MGGSCLEPAFRFSAASSGVLLLFNAHIQHSVVLKETTMASPDALFQHVLRQKYGNQRKLKEILDCMYGPGNYKVRVNDSRWRYLFGGCPLFSALSAPLSCNQQVFGTRKLM